MENLNVDVKNFTQIVGLASCTVGNGNLESCFRVLVACVRCGVVVDTRSLVARTGKPQHPQEISPFTVTPISLILLQISSESLTHHSLNCCLLHCLTYSSLVRTLPPCLTSKPGGMSKTSSITGCYRQPKVDPNRMSVDSVGDGSNPHPRRSKSPSREKINSMKPTTSAADDCKVMPETKSEDQMSGNDAEPNYLTPTSKRTLAEHSFQPEKPKSNHEAERGFTPYLIPRPSSSKEDIANGFQFAKASTMSSGKKEKPSVASAHPTSNREF